MLSGAFSTFGAFSFRPLHRSRTGRLHAAKRGKKCRFETARPEDFAVPVSGAVEISSYCNHIIFILIRYTAQAGTAADLQTAAHPRPDKAGETFAGSRCAVQCARISRHDRHNPCRQSPHQIHKTLFPHCSSSFRHPTARRADMPLIGFILPV